MANLPTTLRRPGAHGARARAPFASVSRISSASSMPATMGMLATLSLRQDRKIEVGVEEDDEVRRADAVLELLDVVGQVEAARFLAALDEDDAARVRYALFLQRPDRGQ